MKRSRDGEDLVNERNEKKMKLSHEENWKQDENKNKEVKNSDSNDFSAFHEFENKDKHLTAMIVEYAVEDIAMEYADTYVRTRYDLTEWLEKFYSFQKIIPVEMISVLIET